MPLKLFYRNYWKQEIQIPSRTQMKTQEITVVKIGGNVIEDVVALETFLATFSKIKGAKILVHGGGKLATSLATKLGITSNLVQGRRITDAKSLEVITMVYAGLANKNIVAQLQAKKCNAIGLLSLIHI